jgi:hypothetical protein
MIMTMRRRIVILLWILGAASALGISTLWVVAAQSGLLSAWALVPFAWSVALLAGLAHHLRDGARTTRYRLDREPLAGPRAGAWLPS